MNPQQPQAVHQAAPQVQQVAPQAHQAAPQVHQAAPQNSWQDVSRMSVDMNRLPAHDPLSSSSDEQSTTVTYLLAGVVIVLLLGAIGVGIYLAVKNDPNSPKSGMYNGGQTNTTCTNSTTAGIAPPGYGTSNGNISGMDLERYRRCCIDQGNYSDGSLNSCCVDASGVPITCPTGAANPWLNCSGISYNSKTSGTQFLTEVASCTGTELTPTDTYKDFTELLVNNGNPSPAT